MAVNSKKIIITGGAGFIGCHSAAHFRWAGAEVIVVDNLSRRGAEANLDWLREQGVDQFIRADVSDAEAMNDLMADHADADAVLHLAAQVAVTGSVADPRTDFESNALGTFNVLEAVRLAARGRPAFLYASTNKVYGGLNHLRVVQRDDRYAYEDLPQGVDELEPLDFHSPYGCSKGASDQYVLDYARIYNMKTVSFRQSCIYGTRQFGVEDQGWVAWFCIAALTGRPFTIFGDGRQVRDLLWVGDLVECYERALERIDSISGEAFNIGGGPRNTLSLLELVAQLERRLGRRLEPAFADWRPGDQRLFVADIGKTDGLLGWSPKIGVDEGLDLLVDWVDEHRFLFLDPVAHALSQTPATNGNGRHKHPDDLAGTIPRFSPSVDVSFASPNDVAPDEIVQQ
jgi:CDP-paratose 2-epimerase